ncbi:UNVERIFIED_CONTAM: hypothetical protein PYX00_010721 [Menopon gallinae]|uniref:Ribosome assembly factor mrt4 n=1 Tax=Menopon gallinae TaxID=328185 RepID=A0AAW2HGZ2_9NEOP
MARSKRRKKIVLTKSKKKGLEFKQRLVEDIRNSVDKYYRIFVFSVENMRGAPLKDVRTQWKHSRFFFGKCKLMTLALGKTPESEAKKNLHELVKYIKGQRGLLFTNEKTEDVVKWFSNFKQPEFARSGNKATKTVTLPEGQLMEFLSSMEPFLRKLGMPTCVKNGKVHLRYEYTVCEKGKILNPEQAHILKLIGERLAEFNIKLKCVWGSDGKIEVLSPDDEGDEEDGDGEDNEVNEDEIEDDDDGEDMTVDS